MSAPGRDRRVAITGIGLLTPLGIGVEACWRGLRAGRCGVGPITRFDPSRIPVRIAAEVADFAPENWLSHRDIRRLDPVVRFAVAAAQLAMDDARHPPARETAGVIVGTAIGGATTIERGIRIAANRPHELSPLFIPNAIPNLAAAVIAQRFGLTGPAWAVATACASSTDAIGQAMRLIRAGQVDLCIAGGAECCVVETVIAGFSNMRALSTRNDEPALASRPFDAGRDGFVVGEGSAMLVLEPLVQALRRGAHIYAEVCGYGQSNDAFHITAPDPSGRSAAAAMRAALADTGGSDVRVDYVNAHATSTRLSDSAESSALRLLFGEYVSQIPVSSTKSMTGHLLGATGAFEAAVCALAIERGWIPPTINFTVPDPECDLDCVPNAGRSQPVSVAMSNSFAFGGHNSSLVFRRLQDCP